MGVSVTDLLTLDPKQVAQFDAELTTLLQEYNPDLDLSIGTFHDLLLHINAVLATATQTNIDLVAQSDSLQAITANPALADPTIVAAEISNYGIVANPGTKATGPITIVLSNLVAVVIPINSVFVINGLSFVTTQTWAARTSPTAVVTPNDVLITQLSAGQYAFTITATAAALGSIYNVPLGAAVIPAVTPASFSSAYAAASFTGGTDPDTNQTLLAKQQNGMAITAWANRPSIFGLIIKQPQFATMLTSSIIGFGDPEMIRDEHTIWPGHTGGRTDLYLVSQGLYQDLVVQLQAALLSKTGPVGTWQLNIGLDVAPGFYDILKILLPSANQAGPGFVPISDVRGIDLSSPTEPPPDIVTVEEGEYSRYQTSTVQFVDTVTDVTSVVIGTPAPYNVVFRIMPQIGAVQDFLSGRAQRPPAGDMEVKAPIPCFTTVAMTVNYNAATTAPTVAAVQNAVANAVNALGFPGSLSASFISQVIQNAFSNVLSVTGYTLAGTIRLPNDTTTSLSDPETITIPSNPTRMSTGRTTAFFLQPLDVAPTLVAVDIPDV